MRWTPWTSPSTTSTPTPVPVAVSYTAVRFPMPGTPEWPAIEPTAVGADLQVVDVAGDIAQLRPDRRTGGSVQRRDVDIALAVHVSSTAHRCTPSNRQDARRSRGRCRRRSGRKVRIDGAGGRRHRRRPRPTRPVDAREHARDVELPGGERHAVDRAARIGTESRAHGPGVPRSSTAMRFRCTPFTLLKLPLTNNDVPSVARSWTLPSVSARTTRSTTPVEASNAARL